MGLTIYYSKSCGMEPGYEAIWVYESCGMKFVNEARGGVGLYF